MPVEILSSNPAVRAVVEGTAPRAARVTAARGVLPIPQNDLLELLVHLSVDPDEEIAKTAKETLTSQDPKSLESLFGTASIAPVVLEHFCSHDELPNKVYESLFRNPATPVQAVASFAQKTRSGELLEILALNQQLLVQSQSLIEAIIANPARTPEAERRATETRREFFEKERGASQIASELRAQGKEAAAEFIENSEFAESIGDGGLTAEDAILLASMVESTDKETDDSWLALEYIEEIYEETAAERQAAYNKILGEWQSEDGTPAPERVSTLNLVMKMGVKDRVKLAMKGDREARNILIRDPNRLVSQAVASNPRITEQEVEMISALRSIPEDVLRSIASNRQWQRSYPIMHNLARNPRTPLANALTIMGRMQLRDLAALAKNRNVSDAVRRQALRLAQARTGK
jgi:hypothetical protein